MTEMIRAAFVNGRERIKADLKFLRRIRAVLAGAE